MIPRRSRIVSLVAVSGAGLLLLTACSADPDPSATPSASNTANGANAASSTGAGRSVPEVLAALNLKDKSGQELIDALDRLPVADRPKDLMASIRPDTLVLKSASGDTSELPLPKDQFYVSVAPYETQTHECFFHSLTTCLGELQNQDVHVSITDSSGKTVVDKDVTTFDNGFFGMWLPRDMEGTMTITRDGKESVSEISTNAESPTCVTTTHLV